MRHYPKSVATLVVFEGQLVSYVLGVYDSILHGSAYLGDWTPDVPDWQRSISDAEGFKVGSGTLTMDVATLRWLFLNGLMFELVEKSGGQVTWQGFIAEMKLTVGEDVWVRSIVDSANAVKAVYSKIGDSQFTNGSAETAAWTAVGTPSTHERTTSWSTHHTYSMHVVTDAADEGTRIENSGSPETITVTAGLAYQCRVTVKVMSGNWILEIKRTTDDVVIASAIAPGDGKSVVTCSVGVENTYSGNVYVTLTADGSGAEIYADGAVFQLSPYRADTKWLTDSLAIDEYGRKEFIIVLGGQSDAGALARVQTYLATHAWPMTRPPRKLEAIQQPELAARFRFGELAAPNAQGSLKFTVLGYWATLAWLYTTSFGTQITSTWVTDLVGLQSDYLAAGIIDENTVDYQVEENIPLQLWDALAEILQMGDGSGNRWQGGGGADRKFNYEQASAEVEYHYRNGRVYSVSGSLVKPTMAKPGLYRLDDMPVGPGTPTSSAEDDPRNVWVSEVKFTAPDKLTLHREVDTE